MQFVSLRVHCAENLQEILISQLFAIGFDSFQEFEDGFSASCDSMLFSQAEVEEVLSTFEHVSFFIQEEDKVNWNEEWEKHYDPIIVENKCIVRAPFHTMKADFDYEIVVTPKMSFGTGHHATTYLMLAFQMKLDHVGKKILDVGSGTGILSIMASKRGASTITAIDTDSWCIENGEENARLNEIKNINFIEGEISVAPNHPYEVILANINKNVLLAQLGQYAERLVNHGTLIISGFYENDIQDLKSAGLMHQLLPTSIEVRDDWAMLVFSKQSI
ncbi:MAG: 50S ribosomal protein L11 methyltransferase [Bacteroidota bacterium]